MRDQRVRHRRLELDSLRSTGVGAFVFTAGQATAQQVTNAVLLRLRKIINIWVSERKPFIYGLTISGELSRISLR
jgi:hypothetical protein